MGDRKPDIQTRSIFFATQQWWRRGQSQGVLPWDDVMEVKGGRSFNFYCSWVKSSSSRFVPLNANILKVSPQLSSAVSRGQYKGRWSPPLCSCTSGVVPSLHHISQIHTRILIFYLQDMWMKKKKKSWSWSATEGKLSQVSKPGQQARFRICIFLFTPQLLLLKSISSPRLLALASPPTPSATLFSSHITTTTTTIHHKISTLQPKELLNLPTCKHGDTRPTRAAGTSEKANKKSHLRWWQNENNTK